MKYCQNNNWYFGYKCMQMEHIAAVSLWDVNDEVMNVHK